MTLLGSNCTRLYYKVEKVLKSYTVYGIANVSNNERIKISNFIRFEPLRVKTKGIDNTFVLKAREGTKWATTGFVWLRPTLKNNVFYGVHKNEDHSLLLIQLSNDKSCLVLDYFNESYPNNLVMNLEFIQNHKFYYS